MKENPNLHLPVLWFNDNSPEDKEVARQELLRAKAGFRRLARILKNRKPSGRLKDFDTPAWQYKLAHDQGTLETLEFIETLIDPIIRNDT